MYTTSCNKRIVTALKLNEIVLSKYAVEIYVHLTLFCNSARVFRAI